MTSRLTVHDSRFLAWAHPSSWVWSLQASALSVEARRPVSGPSLSYSQLKALRALVWPCSPNQHLLPRPPAASTPGARSASASDVAPVMMALGARSVLVSSWEPAPRLPGGSRRSRVYAVAAVIVVSVGIALAELASSLRRRVPLRAEAGIGRWAGLRSGGSVGHAHHGRAWEVTGAAKFSSAGSRRCPSGLLPPLLSL